jgi:hypothetical protein
MVRSIGSARSIRQANGEAPRSEESPVCGGFARLAIVQETCILAKNPIDSATVRSQPPMSSVLKKRRKKMRKHKYRKLRRKQKFLRRKT